MAEGWARALKSEEIEASSAGIVKHGLNPRAVAVMAEAGVDMSGYRSKTIDELPHQDFDYVITLCGHANETCPFFPGPVKRVHHGFDDPPSLARDVESEEEALEHFRRVRDEIREYVLTLPRGM